LPSVPILELNCFIQGNDPSHIFPVKIARTESVGTLKKAIKEEKKPELDHVTASSLKLWKVSIPVNDSFKENISNVELREKETLSPVDKLSYLFTVQPEEGHLHVMVHSPPAGGYKLLLVDSHLLVSTVSNASSAIPPSFSIQTTSR
jgi:hypothetical protein